MQRWFFLDDRKSKSKRHIHKKTMIEKEDEAPTQGIVSTQPWEFAVSVPNVGPKEIVFITGNTTELGEWDYMKIIPLEKKNDSIVWAKTIIIPNTQDVLYRYVIGSVNEETNDIRIVRWETSIKPRVLKDTQLHPLVEDFGKIGDVVEVTAGWLTYQSLLQFKFMNNPLKLKTRFTDRLMNIKVTPVNLSFTSEGLEETQSTSSLDVVSPTATSVEVSTLSTDPSVCVLSPQEQFGREYKPNDILIINVSVPNVKSLAYLVDFYSYSNRASVNDPPCHIGYTYVLPNMIKPSEGSLQIPVTCNVKHRPLGTVNIEYLAVYPLQEKLCDLQVSYSKFWEKTWRGLDVGHRGLGASFKTKGETPIRENTIASLKKAAASGADLLEFDVQLSKDMIPVIYHDYYVCISMKRKREVDFTEMLEMPVKDLSLEHLQKLKVYHLVEGRTHDNSFFDDEDLEEHQPFPTLEASFKAIDTTVGFNIELKWTMELADGSFELINPFDMNTYVDKVLEVVLKNAGDRRIVFSCFNPDICTMVRYKQNKYPVMFLTVGMTNKYQPYRDPRCLTIPAAVQHAVSADILGIAVHSEDLLRDPSQVKFATDAGLVMFCWGDDNNDKNNIKKLKELGLHAVIYDHLDQYTTKEVKESIFLVEARDSQRELVRAALLEGDAGSSSSSSEHSGRAFLDLAMLTRVPNGSTVTSLESLASSTDIADPDSERAPKRNIIAEVMKECQLKQSFHGLFPAGDTSADNAKKPKKSRNKH